MSAWADQEQGYKVQQGVPAYYGTFQGQQQPGYPPPSSSPEQGQLYPPVAPMRQSRFVEGRPLLGGEHYEGSGSLPFCNLGYGWFLFLLGFFFVLPWYVGVVMLFCLAHDNRERPGLVGCTLAAVVVLFFGGWRTSYYYYG